MKSARYELAGLARAHNKHGEALQAPEELARQLHPGGGDGRRPASHGCLVAGATTHADRVSEEPIQVGAGGAVRPRLVRRDSDLAQDLGLPQHHRVEARRHPEQVAHRLGAGVGVEVGFDRLTAGVPVGAQKIHQRFGAAAVGEGCVDLGAVAGAQDGALEGVASQQVESLREPLRARRQQLAHLDGGDLVADACDDSGEHGVALSPPPTGRPRPGSRRPTLGRRPDRLPPAIAGAAQ